MTAVLRIAFFAILLVGVSCTKEITNDLRETAAKNKVPSSNAGSAKSITLPLDSVTVTGSGSDSAGTIVGYLWSKVSGPQSYLIVNPGSATTVIKNLTQGIYTFQLMVTDNEGATGVSSMTVTVNPSLDQTVTFQPANNMNEWSLINKNGVDESATNRPDIPVEAWTHSGNPLVIREVIKFDMSGIPANATILSATLHLYSYPSPTLNGNLTDANFGSNNTMLVQQVSSNWSTLTWAGQPASTATNQIVVPHTNQSTLDLQLNVTSMVASMVNNNANYGFMLKLQNESPLNSRIFVSSFNTTYPDKRPKLVITYRL